MAGIKKPKGADAHLRSTQAVRGYHLQATDGISGHICDFMMDEENWIINELVIKIGHRFSGNEVLIPVSRVSRISYEESTVFVDMTKAAIEQSPAPVIEFTPPPLDFTKAVAITH